MEIFFWGMSSIRYPSTPIFFFCSFCFYIILPFRTLKIIFFFFFFFSSASFSSFSARPFYLHCFHSPSPSVPPPPTAPHISSSDFPHSQRSVPFFFFFFHEFFNMIFFVKKFGGAIIKQIKCLKISR